MLLPTHIHLVRMLASTVLLSLSYNVHIVSQATARLDERHIAKAHNRQTSLENHHTSSIVPSHRQVSVAATGDRDARINRNNNLQLQQQGGGYSDAVSQRANEITYLDEFNVPGGTEQRLLRALLRDYDVDARGVDDVNKTVNVLMEFLLLRIQGLDERSQVLTTTGLLICDWEDNRLRWNASDFDQLEDIVLKPERIWLPELSLMNGAEDLAPDFRKVRVLVRHDGRVHWEPGGVFTTTCDIDIRYFPFDDQSCPIHFGAWAYYSARMNITTNSSIVKTHEFKLNGEWDIYRTRAQWKETVIPCCPNTRYSYVEFTLYLRRRYTFYVMNVIVPCLLLSVLVMVGFCLPPDAGEKISLGISVLLAFTVFLLMVAENVPRTSLRTPVIVVYLTCTMGLGTASVCMTVLVLNLHHRDIERPVPCWARVFVLRYLAALLCVGARKPKTMAVNLQNTNSDGDDVITDSSGLKEGLRQFVRDGELLRAVTVAAPGGHRVTSAVGRMLLDSTETLNPCDRAHEWKELAHVVDRLFFAIVFTLMSASVMIIVLVPFYKDEIQFTDE